MTRSGNRQFSMPSIRVLADNISFQVHPNAVDSVLQTVAQIDQQIHNYFNKVLAAERKQHDETRQQLKSEQGTVRFLRSKLKDYELKDYEFKNNERNTHISDITTTTTTVCSPTTDLLDTKCDCRLHEKDALDGSALNGEEEDIAKATRVFVVSDHSSQCALRRALLTRSSPSKLCDLLLSREDACRNQTVLIARLKMDNRQLRETYEDVCIRYQRLYEENHHHTEQQQHYKQQQLPLQQLQQNGKGGNGSGFRCAGGTDRLEVLSVKLQRAGQVACDVASRVEERLKITARDVSNLRRSFQLPSQHDHETDLISPSTLSSSTFNEDNNKTADISRLTASSPSSSPCHIRSPCLSLRAAASTSLTSTALMDEYENDSTCPDILNDVTTIFNHDNHQTQIPPTRTKKSKYVSTRTEAEMESEMEHHYRQATDELMKTMALQEDAHNKLSLTVQELTLELGRIDPNMLSDLKKFKHQAQSAEKKKMDSLSKLQEKDGEILDLRRQLTKVIAEYEAISVAHSYSNAELSKIRAKTKQAAVAAANASGAGGSGKGGDVDGGKRNYVHGQTVLTDNFENRHHRKFHLR